MKRNLATLFGIGLVPFAPGTAGSIVALGLAAGILSLPYGWAWLALGIIVFTRLGTIAADRHMRAHGTDHDPKEIVIDELVGQWLTFTVWQIWMVTLAGLGSALVLLNEVQASPLYLGLGFILFRFYDIVKPWPISLADRKIKGGWGVMFDDLLAAVAAGTTLYVIYLVLPYITGQMTEYSV
jgi:phosphatidylglycerophosphatase A